MTDTAGEHQVRTEEFVAKRVEELRIREGWSYADLSQRMAQVGYPIERSSLQKIERGNPRRKITVNELVAFSTVFGIDVTDLLVSPEYRSNILFWTDMQDGPNKMRTALVAEEAYNLLANRVVDACMDPQEGRARIKGIFKRFKALKAAEQKDKEPWEAYLVTFLSDIRMRVAERLAEEGNLEWLGDLKEFDDGEGD